MPRPSGGPRLGAGPAHERAILRGLSRSLIAHGRVVTTESKARKLRPYVEKLITKARKGGLHRRRQALSELGDRKIVHRLFGEVGPRAGDRPGGYTRILKLGPRRGDASPMAIIELVDAPAARAPEPEPEKKGRRGRRRRRAAEEAPEEQTPEEETAAGPEASTEGTEES
ncbi:MAG: 50S ribosomal protein L17 [bacterium]